MRSRRRESAQARLLLRVLSCLAPAVPIPPGVLDRAVLARACQQGEEGAAEGLAALAAAGLITIHPCPEGTWPSVAVHPLVTETNRLRLDTEDPGRTGGIAVALLTVAAARLGYDRPQDWPAWVQLVPHLAAVWGYLANRLTGGDLTALAKITESAAQAFLWAGSYLASLELADSALGHAARLGADHPAVLALRHQIASAHMYHGDYTEAMQEYREVLAARRRVLGADHPDTLETQHCIAWMFASQGEYEQAEQVFREVLAARLQVLAQDHSDTLTTQNGIARMLASQGKYEQAEQEYREVLAARQRVLGPDHPDTLNTRHGIARMLDWRGDHEQAEQEFREVLAAMRRVLGPDHPDTARHPA